jgi:eukaryotic-like serine/threonine-protein kinase
MIRSYADEETNRLLQAGELKGAAERLYQLRAKKEALDLLESIFDYERAAEVALEIGDRPRALGNYLDARSPNQAVRIRESIAAGSNQEVVQAAEVYELRKMWAAAAELYELASDPAKAAELWKLHGDLARAARRYEESGAFKKAGECYETHLREVPNDPEASLRLGRILLRFRYHNEAIPHLQKAAEERPLRIPSLETLVKAFDAAGLSNAAKDSYSMLRSLRPELPTRCEEYLAELRRSEEQRAEDRLLIGRYRMGKLLGSGGTARVYVAIDEFSAREVALKIFAGANSKGRDVFQRFIREAKIVSSLSHPCVVRVFEMHPAHGFLVMEYMSGGTLEERLTPDFPLSQTPSVIKAVCSGLEVAHTHGIIHRDIKPPNIFFGIAGEVKIGDFGVAHLQDLGATQTGGFIGTLAYMAPEQVTGAPLSAAADQYALGVTLYRMLTGRLPFDGTDIASQHLSRTPDAPSVHRPGLPTELDLLVLQTLEKDPQKRFPSVAHLRDAFLRLDLKDTPAPALQLPSPQVIAPVAPHAGPRYQEERLLVEADGRRLVVAHDQKLKRRVVLETIREEALLAAWRENIAALSRVDDSAAEALLTLEGDCAIWEYTSGETLSAVCAVKPLAVIKALDFLTHISRAVASIHAVGVAHGAISPESVLISPQYTLLISRRTLSTKAETAAADVNALASLLVASLGGGAQEDSWAEAAALLSSEISSDGQQLLQEITHHPPNAAAQVTALVRALSLNAKTRARRVAALAWVAAVAAESRSDSALRTARDAIQQRAKLWGLPEEISVELLRSASPVRRG